MKCLDINKNSLPLHPQSRGDCISSLKNLHIDNVVQAFYYSYF